MKNILICAFILSFPPIFAQENPTTTALEKTAVVSTSKANRLDKKFSILAGGGYEATQDAFHVAVDYFYNPNQVLELKGVHGSGDENVTSVTLGMKFFQRNSFYVKPSIGYLKFIDKTFLNLLFSSKDYEELKAITVGASIGNQWQYDNFTFGVDWVGISKAVITLEAENDPNKTLPTLLVIFLGYSF